jgi:hypothetical protein
VDWRGSRTDVHHAGRSAWKWWVIRNLSGVDAAAFGIIGLLEEHPVEKGSVIGVGETGMLSHAQAPSFGYLSEEERNHVLDSDPFDIEPPAVADEVRQLRTVGRDRGEGHRRRRDGLLRTSLAKSSSSRCGASSGKVRERIQDASCSRCPPRRLLQTSANRALSSPGWRAGVGRRSCRGSSLSLVLIPTACMIAAGRGTIITMSSVNASELAKVSSSPVAPHDRCSTAFKDEKRRIRPSCTSLPSGTVRRTDAMSTVGGRLILRGKSGQLS